MGEGQGSLRRFNQDGFRCHWENLAEQAARARRNRRRGWARRHNPRSTPGTRRAGSRHCASTNTSREIGTAPAAPPAREFAIPPDRARYGKLRELRHRSTRISPIPGTRAAPNATRLLSLRSSRPRPSGIRKFRSRWRETRFPEIVLNGQLPDTNGSNSRGLTALRRCRLAKPARPYGSREKPADDSLASAAPPRLDIRRSFGIQQEVRGRRRDGLHRRPRLHREGTHSLH